MKKSIIVIGIVITLVAVIYIGYNILSSKNDREVTSIEVTGIEIDYSRIVEDNKAKELVSILEELKYTEELCNGITEYTLQCDNGTTYYIKSDCNGIVKNGKQAEVSEEKIKEIENIILNSPNKKRGLEDLPEEISVEQAVEYGYFVIDGENNNVYNKDVLDRFVENTKMDAINRVADKIRIATYNVDGYPTIYDLEYKIFNEKYKNKERKKSK